MVTNGDILDVAGSAGADAGTSYTFSELLSSPSLPLGGDADDLSSVRQD